MPLLTKDVSVRVNSLQSWRIVTILLVTTAMAPMALLPTAHSQVRGAKPAPQESNIGDGIPDAALESDRGRDLADQLRRLRRAQSTMGKNHPSLGTVREEIARVEKELQAWLPKAEEGKSITGSNNEMNPDELRQLILQMAVQIKRLESRVDALEKRLEVF